MNTKKLENLQKSQPKPQEVLPVNTKAKDTFFKTVYASEERQRKLASFLLGMEGKEITVANVRPVLFGKRENDLSFVTDAIFYVMTENQATVCSNVPYRLLEYITSGLRSTVDSEKLPEKVQYDIRLSDSYMTVEQQHKNALTEPDLEAVVHVYDFRMTLKEMLEYIESGTQPERFAPYQGDLLDYALTANGITYIQRAVKKEKQNQYDMPDNVTSVADYLELLIKRDIFVDLLTDKEVCDMTMAQFSRDDILLYQGREEGREEGERIGELRGVIRTYQKLGISLETARQYIMKEFGTNAAEAEELLRTYWKV
ncbi:MAG: hypothetical protein K1W38_09055 [Lachnospiraceae bacterium]